MTSEFERRLQDIYRENCEKLPPSLVTAISKTANVLNQSGITQTSIQVGDKVADFSFQSAWSDATSLNQLLESGPVIISFYRGFWCSYCRAELAEYQKVLPQLQLAGQNRTPPIKVHYLAICPQQIIDSQIDLAQHRYIIDNDLTIARQFGIVYQQPWEELDAFANMGFSVAHVNKMKRCELSLPAVFIINQKGIVTYRLVSTDYRMRQDPSELIDLI